MGKKEEVQEIVATRLTKEGGGLIIFPTGVGKTKMAIDTLTKLSNIRKALIITSLATGRDVTWPEEISKWNKKLIDRVDIICYDSLHKYVNSNYDVIVYDECHHITEAMTQFLKNQRSTFTIAMTATLPIKKEKLHLLFEVLKLKIVAKMSIEKAVELGLISPFHITRVNMKLDGIKKNVIAGSKAQPFTTTELANYEWLTKKVDQYALSNASNASQLYRFSVLKRMHFINSLQSKVNCSINTMKKLRFEGKERILVFSKSINSARAISPYCYHSKTSKKDLNRFIDKTINTLSVVDALNESVNLPDMDSVIINQLNSSDLVFIQQLGRLIRFRYGFTGTVFVLVALNTVDENWFYQATKDLTINKTIDYEEFIN